MNQNDHFNDLPVILLAAGKSTRMGIPKGLVPVGDKTWLEVQIESLIEAEMRNVICVLGHYENEYRDVLQNIVATEEAEGLNLAITVNAEPDRGQFSSIQEGLKVVLNDEVWSQAKGVFIQPVDVPVASAEVWQELAENVFEFLVRDVEERYCVAMPEFQDRGGHPVLLSMEYVRELVKVPAVGESARLDHQIHTLQRDQILRVKSVDSGVVKNFNKPEDFAKMSPKEEKTNPELRIETLKKNNKNHYPTERDLVLAKSERKKREKELGYKTKKKKLRKEVWGRDED